MSILIRYTKYSKDLHLKGKKKATEEGEKFKVQSLAKEN